MQSEGFPFFLTRPLQLVNACVHDAAEAIIELLKHVGEMMKKKDRKRERKKERKKESKKKEGNFCIFVDTKSTFVYYVQRERDQERERERERERKKEWE